MAIEGVTVSVSQKMEAVQATILREDGSLFRLCQHRQRHPVGSIHQSAVTMADADEHTKRGC